MANKFIVVCGQKYDIGVPVILWSDPEGLNAYDISTKTVKIQDRKTGRILIQTISGKRYGSRSLLTSEPNLSQLQKIIKQFFLHHTGIYNAEDTFEVLHNERKLSVTFILDDNGDLFQTLDVKEKAWHGGENNAISIGIEICSRAAAGKFPDAYDKYHQEKYNLLPRRRRIDYIQKEWIQGFEYNDAQYRTLIRLGKCLKEIFNLQTPGGKYAVDFPRANNRTIEYAISKPLLHNGIICHYNTTIQKIDPISFDHERFLRGINGDGTDGGSTFINFTKISTRQSALNKLGYNLDVDGDWGALSQAALEKFQHGVGLIPGQWGEKTEYMLDWAIKGLK